MPFTVTEYLDLVRLLGEHPEWRTELRRLLLADDILELPRIVRELAEAQERTESRLERLEATVQNLVEAQQRTEARLQELVEVQRLTEEEVRKLATTTQKARSSSNPGWTGAVLGCPSRSNPLSAWRYKLQLVQLPNL
ncbi:MAG: hypothetical protein ACE5LU_23995 [Anaerolineae bacterium]